MGLESASFIADLNPAWPLPTDQVLEGDDHLINLKLCLQAQFPNLGNAVAVNPTAAELNFVVGVTSALQPQLDGKQALVSGAANGNAILADGSNGMKDSGVVFEQQVPTGTVVVFYQAAAPDLWLRINNVEDRLLGFITSAAGTPNAGGTWTVSGLAAAATTATGEVALTAAQIPSHTHGFTAAITADNVTAGGGLSRTILGGVSTTDGGTGGNQPHSHSAPSYNVSQNGAWRPPISWCLKASKNAPVAL